MQTYEGYFEDGRFFPLGQPSYIPNKRRVIVTVLDESPQITTHDEHAKAWSDFLEEISKIDNEPLPEFERVKFREVDI